MWRIDTLRARPRDLVRVLEAPRWRRRRVHEVAGVHVHREAEALGDVERRRAVAAGMVAPLAALGALALVEDVVLRRRPQLGEEDELEPHRRADHEDAHEREEAVALRRLVGHELWHGSGGCSARSVAAGAVKSASAEPPTSARGGSNKSLLARSRGARSQTLPSVSALRGAAVRPAAGLAGGLPVGSAAQR